MSDRFPAARPRPVADAPVDRLVAAAHDLAKHWLMALIATSPLEHVRDLPLVELSLEAPTLCVEVARALSSDRELDRLEPGGDLYSLAGRAGLLAGAQDPAAAVAAVEALRGVLWGAVLEELRAPTSAQVAELAERLAHVCATIAGAAAAAAPAAGFGPPLAAVRDDASTSGDSPAAPGPAAAPGFSGAFDDFVVSPPAPADVAEAIEEHDVASEGPAAWIGSIGRRLERHAEDAAPFAVLLIELADIDRLRHAERELDPLVGRVERALSGELRPADVLTRERAGRYWLVTPDTDAGTARALAERLARAVADSTSHRGVPLQVAIGTAICPDDGDEPAALAAHADVGVYSARASGLTMSPLEGEA